jgi:hypothetical protein
MLQAGHRGKDSLEVGWSRRQWVQAWSFEGCSSCRSSMLQKFMKEANDVRRGTGEVTP